MPGCTTCTHPSTLHNMNGTCSIDGCACDQLIVAEFAPDVPPPKPGACLHIMAEGAIWVVEEVEEVEEKLNGSSDFCDLTMCDFEEAANKRVYCTVPLRVRPQAISSYHGFPQERWDHILDAIR